MMSSTPTSQVSTEDKWSLEMEVLASTGAPRGAVLLLHAMMVNRGTMDRRGKGLASILAAQGWQVYVADFRGHGGSGPNVKEGGGWSYDDLVRYDVPALVAAVRQRHDPGFPLFIVGHSLGGHVALASAVTTYPEPLADGYVLLSANVWLKRHEKNGCRYLAKLVLVDHFCRFCDLVGYVPAKRLGWGNEDEALKYMRDLASFWVDDSWASEDRKINYMNPSWEKAPPILGIVGRGDRFLAHHAAARKWLAEFSEDAEFWLVGQPEGYGSDFNHMSLVTDRRATPVWKRLSQWMDEQIEKSPATLG